MAVSPALPRPEPIEPLQKLVRLNLGSGRREPSSAEARDCIKQTAWGPTYTKHIT